MSKNTAPTQKSLKNPFVLGAVLVAGMMIGSLGMYAWLQAGESPAKKTDELRSLSDRGHTLTNPLLACADVPEAISIGDRKKLQSEVQQIIDKSKADGSITEASVYYRDLNNGPWFGINEEAKFDPASLFKVPLAMTYLWLANEGQDVLDEQIEYKGPPGTTVAFFPPSMRLPVGHIYTIRELIEYMLKYSDNDAAYILSGYAGLDERNQIYTDLGLEKLQEGKDYIVDVHTYASFFRILYNATYLGLQNSEYILKLLSETDFNKGIVAGVPAGTAVAHKFGEHVTETPAGKVYQLHDCGIVYAPDKPYVLCVMTRGRDMQKLPGFISSVSKVVYDEVH